MNFTTYKNLQKPLSTEKYDISVFNTNADMIDSELNNLDRKIQSQDSLLDSHISNISNPHGVTKDQVGLSDVPNVTTNDQIPTFTEAITRENITSGEKLSVIFGKIMKWFSDLKSVAFSGSYNDLSNKPNAQDIGALSLTGGSVTGRLKVYAQGTEADPRFDVQAGRVDILKTDGGDSAMKITEDAVTINANTEVKGTLRAVHGIEAKDIDADTQASTITYSNIRAYTTESGSQKLNILASGSNASYPSYNVGAQVEANTSETSETEPKIAVGRFSSDNNISALISGLMIAPGNTYLRNGSCKVALGDDNDLDVTGGKVKIVGTASVNVQSPDLQLDIGQNKPALEANRNRTKIRVEKTNSGEVGYVDIEQSGNIYAGASHQFLDENENPGIIEAGGLKIGGFRVDKRPVGLLSDPDNSAIVSAEEMCPITIEMIAYDAEDDSLLGVYSDVITRKNTQVVINGGTSSLPSDYGTITTTTDGIMINAHNSPAITLYVWVTGACGAMITTT